MAFHVSCNFPSIRSYADAVKSWQSAMIFPHNRKRPEADQLVLPRGLDGTRKKHLTVERAFDTQDIVLRLYDHPVVTWHKDNSLTICGGWNTVSTVVFANSCTPQDLIVHRRYDNLSVFVDGRTYKVGKQITLRQQDNTWKVDQVTPWSILVVNRERARHALRESGYTEFRTWLQIYVQMAARPQNGGRWIDDKSVIAMLRDRNRWRELTEHFPTAWYNHKRVLQTFRKTIYTRYDCIDKKSVESVRFLG